MAQEAAKATKIAAYEHGVLETETRLTAEVAGVYGTTALKHTSKPLIGQESLRTPI